MIDELPPVAILAGGLGTRLYPMTQVIPKALITINDSPFLDHQLRLLHSKGITRVVMCVGHLGKMIRDYAGDGRRWGMHLDYVFDGDTLLGTAGAIKNALPVLDKEFFIIYGDSYLLCDYANVYKQFVHAKQPALMTVYRNEGQWDTSNVIYDEGKVTLYDKRNPTPQMIYIDYGLAVVKAEVFRDVSTTEPTDLAVIYHSLSQQGQLAGYEVNHRFYEVGTPQGIKDFEAYLSS